MLIKAEKKFGKAQFRLGKVEKTLPDSHGTVRTVIVSTRNRRQGVRQGRVDSEIGVQRLVVILPVQEAWKGGLPEATG